MSGLRDLGVLYVIGVNIIHASHGVTAHFGKLGVESARQVVRVIREIHEGMGKRTLLHGRARASNCHP